ncbi:MAG: TrkA family potassium uptake protein [Dehalococcoidia bacterium]|nr:TrkA family potassium uptake protein [Dehalococcoidia bacterium]
MYIVVVGGGTVGYGLTIELLRNSEHEVVLVDNDGSVVRDLRDELGDSVVHGDGTEVVFLESIGLARADLVVAVTGNDSHNLVASQVAKHWFHVPRAIARVNDPLNERLFRLLGVDSTVSAAAAVLAQLEVDLPEHTLVPLMHLRRRGLEVVDLHVQPGSPAAGRAIRDLTLPPQALISLVVGLDGTPQVPTGDTILQVGDELIAVIAEDSESALRHLVAAPLVLEPDPVRGD